MTDAEREYELEEAVRTLAYHMRELSCSFGEAAYLAELRRKIAEEKRKVAALLAREAWQPIETAPKDGTWVLTIGKNGAGFWTIPQTVRWTGLWESPVHDARVEAYHQPTHWMPLPPAPTTDEERGGATTC